MFEEFRRQLKYTVCTSVEEVEKIIIEALRHYWDNPDVQSIILMRKFYTTTDSNMKQQIMENNAM